MAFRPDSCQNWAMKFWLGDPERVANLAFLLSLLVYPHLKWEAIMDAVN